MGRIYPEKLLFLCLLHRRTRHAFCINAYINIDMKNAHPAVISNICYLNGVSCPTIDGYCSNRDDF